MLWNDDNSPRKAVAALTQYYDPINVYGSIKDHIGQPISGVKVVGKERQITTRDGTYALPAINNELVSFQKDGYLSVLININKENSNDIRQDIVMKKIQLSFFDSILLELRKFFLITDN